MNERNEIAQDAKRPIDRIVSTCETCKGFGAQGMMMYTKETGDYRWCGIAMFGDFDRDSTPMPEFKVTYGNMNGAKGQIVVHKSFGCINHNPKFDEY